MSRLEAESKPVDRRHAALCDECGEWRRLNPIHDSYSPDVTKRICDECKARRDGTLEAFYRGD